MRVTASQADGQEADFRTDLRRLGGIYRAHVAEKVSQNRLARATGVRSTTAGAWLKGEVVPQQVDILVKLIELLKVEVAAAGVDLPSADRRLLDTDEWRRRHTALARLRSKAVGVGVQRAHALAALAADEARTRQNGLLDKPRPFASWEPQQLGVHPAIHGEPTPKPEYGFVLPDYVEREHDRHLRARLETAKAGDRAVLTVVRGGSCTGKTRTAYEAARAYLDDWELVFPKGTASLLALLAADALAPRTILWLNEAQDYLTGSAGEEAAAGLRRRLEGEGPLVIIATLWPADHNTLTAARPNGGEDTHQQARALLGTVTPIDVPNAFTSSDLRSLHASRHASLETAARTSPTGAITQTLAAGPQLVDRYESAVPPAGPYGRAIITAAMDARRFGQTTPVNDAFLEAAAPGYLTGRQRADADPAAWYADALRYAREKVLDVAAALEPVASPTGMGSVPGQYRLADYLDHHARTTRRYEFPPASFWTAVQNHATAAELGSLGVAAEGHGRYRIAASFYERAVEGGETEFIGWLARLRMRSGNVAQAKTLFQKAAAHGSRWAWRELMNLEEAAEDPGAAEALLRQAAASGDHGSLFTLVDRLERAGNQSEAEALAREAHADGETWILRQLVDLRWVLGDRTGAELLLQELAEGGDRIALHDLAMIRKRAGDLDAAEALLREAAAAGHSDALYSLMELRQERGDQEGAAALLQEAGDAGHSTALWDLALKSEEAGDQDEAERLAMMAGLDGDPGPLLELAPLREAAGDRVKAEQLARAAAAAGDTDALHDLAMRREKSGDHEGAERLAREATAGGSPYALQNLARLREETGDLDGARRLAWEAVRAGEPDVLHHLVERQLEDGDDEGAERSVLNAANCGYPWAVEELAWLREKAGKPTEAEQIRRFGVEADGSASEQLP